MGPAWSVIVRVLGRVIGAAGVALALLAPVASVAAAEDIRGLLRDLWIQVPSREANAPAFSLPDVNGTTVGLADLKGRAVMLYFWTTY